MDFIVNNQESSQIVMHTVPTQRISTILIDQIQTFHVYRKVHSMLASHCSTVYHVLFYLMPPAVLIKLLHIVTMYLFSTAYFIHRLV